MAKSGKIKVSMKGIHKAIASLDKRLAKVQIDRPGLASIVNTRSLLRQLKTATKCQVNMVAEF